MRVIGVGQEMAGDDGVGLAVVRDLARRAPRNVEIREVAEPSALVPLLEEGGRVVIVDAFLGREPGQVRRLSLAQLDLERRPLSSHGLTVPQAVELARALAPNAPARVDFVGVAIDAVRGLASELSPSVAAAVTRAADLAIAIVAEDDRRA